MQIPARKQFVASEPVSIPVLGLGGIPLRDLTPQESRPIIEKAYAAGIRFVDSARAYTGSEQAVREVLLDNGVTDMLLSGKSMDRTSIGILGDVTETRKTFGVNQLDFFWIHHVMFQHELDQVTGKQGALEGLQKLKRMGSIRFIGLSGHCPDVLMTALELNAFDCIQCPLNILDYSLFAPVVEYARLQNIPVFGIKPLRGGQLGNSSNTAIRFACQMRGVTCSLIGPRNVEELGECIRAAISEAPVTDMDLHAVRSDQALQNSLPSCQFCGYCETRCPIHLPIRQFIEAYYLTELYRSGHRAKHWYDANKVTLGRCTGCRSCESICPQHISISKLMTEAQIALEQPVSSKEIRYHVQTSTE